MQISEEMKNKIKEHLGYNDRELSLFLDNPRNQDVLSKGLKFLGKTIIIEVVEAHGCNCQHKVGDKFYFDGAGKLLTKLCPDKICLLAISAVDKLVFAACELLLAGVDPNQLRFNRAGCFDIGLECGGWGKIIMEISVVDRKSLKK